MRSPGSILAVVLLVALGSPAVPSLGSADCVDYRDFIHWVGSIDTSGAARDVAVSGSFAYVATTPGNADGVGLDVIGIGMSTTYPPKTVGSVDLGGPQVWEARVTASGAYAYVTTSQYCQGGALRVVDATDPAHPELVGELAILGDTYVVTVSGTYAYLAEGCRYEGLEVIDISDPRNPRRVGGVATPGYAYGMAVSGTRAYVAAQDWHYPYVGSLQVIDISDPENPSILGSIVMAVGPVAVSGNIAYVGVGGTGVYAVDISDPVSPHIVGSVELDQYATVSRVVVSGPHLYVAGSPFQVFDISDPANLKVAGSVDLVGAGGLAIAGPFAYVTSGRLEMIAISNPGSPPLVGSVDTPGQARDVAVVGTHAYVADWPEGLQVIDIANPGDPHIVGQMATPGYAEHVAARGTLVYMALGSSPPVGPPGGLAVIDVRRPQSPRQLGSVALQHSSRGLAVVGNYAYVSGNTDTTGRLSVIDIRDSHDPRVVGSVSIPAFARGLAVSETHAFVAVKSVDYPYVYSLQGIDVRNPALPWLSGKLDLPQGAAAVTLSGDYAFVLGFQLQVVDVSNPYNMKLVSTVELPGNPGNHPAVTVSGNLAYAAMVGSVQAIDVENSRYARPVAGAPGGGGGLAVSGDYLYAAAGLRGLLVLPTHCQLKGSSESERFSHD